MLRGKSQIVGLIALILLLVVAATSYYLTREVGKKDKKEAPSILWELALDKVHKAWKGEISLSDPQLRKNCPHLSLEKDDIPSELKSCRRELFYCFFKEREEGIKNQKDFLPLEVKFSKNFLDSGEIVISLNGESKPFELNNFCQQVTLPNGAYWGDRSNDKNKRIWHTSNVNYSVDKFLVRNIDIREWLLRKKDSSLKKLNEFQKEDYFRPSVNLSADEMESFCRFRGMEVLNSRVRAALTFHHGRSQSDLIPLEPPSFNSPEHPFGIRKQDSPQYRFSHAKDGDLKIKKEDCRLIYSSECLEYPYFELFPNSMGWSGVSELLGGPAEYVKNLKYPRKNLHPSSYYHPIKSKVHQAGVRVYWSGKDHRRIDFNFFTEPFFEVNKDKPEDYFDVGFRCMKKVEAS